MRPDWYFDGDDLWGDEPPQDRMEVEGLPLLRNANPFKQNGRMWMAYERGERYCPRCKWACDDVNNYGCDQCGGRLFGRDA